jgi:hypothetical protein
LSAVCLSCFVPHPRFVPSLNYLLTYLLSLIFAISIRISSFAFSSSFFLFSPNQCIRFFNFLSQPLYAFSPYHSFPSSVYYALKMGAVFSSETLVNICQITRRHFAGNNNPLYLFCLHKKSSTEAIHLRTRPGIVCTLSQASPELLVQQLSRERSVLIIRDDLAALRPADISMERIRQRA